MFVLSEGSSTTDDMNMVPPWTSLARQPVFCSGSGQSELSSLAARAQLGFHSKTPFGRRRM